MRVVLCALLLAACAPKQHVFREPPTFRITPTVSPTATPVPVSPSPTHVVIAQAAAPAPLHQFPCRASWYAVGLAHPEALTAAHRTLAKGTVVNVTYRGRTIKVVITDRGPWTKDRHGNYDRQLDLSKGAFAALAPLPTGVIDAECSIM